MSSIFIILGWFMIGYGFTMKTGHPINTIVFLSGFLLFVFGIVWLVISLNSKPEK